MKYLFQTMDLPEKITLIQFIEKYSELQNNAERYQQELQNVFKDGLAEELKKGMS